MCLPRKVRQRVDTLLYKVELVWLPAAVENFEVKDPLEKESMPLGAEGVLPRG